MEKLLFETLFLKELLGNKLYFQMIFLSLVGLKTLLQRIASFKSICLTEMGEQFHIDMVQILTACQQQATRHGHIETILSRLTMLEQPSMPEPLFPFNQANREELITLFSQTPGLTFKIISLTRSYHLSSLLLSPASVKSILNITLLETFQPKW